MGPHRVSLFLYRHYSLFQVLDQRSYHNEPLFLFLISDYQPPVYFFKKLWLIYPGSGVTLSGFILVVSGLTSNSPVMS